MKATFLLKVGSSETLFLDIDSMPETGSLSILLGIFVVAPPKTLALGGNDPSDLFMPSG